MSGVFREGDLTEEEARGFHYAANKWFKISLAHLIEHNTSSCNLCLGIQMVIAFNKELTNKIQSLKK